MTKNKLERQDSNFSRSYRKYPPGMTYEEIASSRTPIISKKINVDNAISPDRYSIESVEPLQEKDIKATGSDPYEKLDYKTSKIN